MLHKYRPRFKCSVTIFLLILLSGCTVKAPVWIYTYNVSEHPNSKTATFLHNFSNYQEILIIDGIEYTKTYDELNNHFKVLPGTHTIHYTLVCKKRGYVEGTISLDMKAGHTYILSRLRKGVIHRRCIVTIIDKTADEVVYETTFTDIGLVRWNYMGGSEFLLSDDQLVKFQYYHSVYDPEFVSIDGNIVYPKSTNQPRAISYKLLPEQHEIRYKVKVPWHDYIEGVILLDFKKGHHYILRQDFPLFYPKKATVTVTDVTEDKVVYKATFFRP